MSINVPFTNTDFDPSFTTTEREVLRRLLNRLAAAVPSELPIDTTAPDNGDTLIYNSVSGLFEPSPPSGGGPAASSYTATFTNEVGASNTNGQTCTVNYYIVDNTIVHAFFILPFTGPASNTNWEMSFNLPTISGYTNNVVSLCGVATTQDIIGSADVPLVFNISRKSAFSSGGNLPMLNGYMLSTYSGGHNLFGQFSFLITPS